MAELKFPTLEELGRQGGEWALNEFEYKGLTIREWVDEITTGEYQPIKHGHWIDDHDFARCSLCNRIIYDAYYEFRNKNDASFHNYCPYCSTKMDLKDGESNE